MKVALSQQANAPAVVVLDVACGAGHCLAIAEGGLLYRWGLNKCGQLGLGDTITRHVPVGAALTQSGCDDDEAKMCVLAQVFAYAHSSAGIDTSGRLFTWGSNDNGRLMHSTASEPDFRSEEVLPTRTNSRLSLGATATAAVPSSPGKPPAKVIAFETAPKLVVSDKLSGCRVQSFAFSKLNSAVLVHTTVTKVINEPMFQFANSQIAFIAQVSPTSGPKRTFSKLEISGFGLWDSPNIVLKFSSKVYSAYNPPRSCAGHLRPSPLGDGAGVITCHPPKFAETGDYLVSVAMDGVNFLPQLLDVAVYQEAAVLSQTPDLQDRRSVGGEAQQIRLVSLASTLFYFVI